MMCQSHEKRSSQFFLNTQVSEYIGSFFNTSKFRFFNQEVLSNSDTNHEDDMEALALFKNTRKWPETSPGVYRIPYEIDEKFELEEVFYILYGMDVVERGSNIIFEPKQPHETNFLNFIKANGCKSLVGYIGGNQTVILGGDCLFPGNVIHEIFHALGFIHEHQRDERNKYVKYVTDASLLNNSSQISPINSMPLTEYDVWSITHYPTFNATHNGYENLIFVGERFYNKKFESAWRRFPSYCDWYGINQVYPGKKRYTSCWIHKRVHEYFHPSIAMLQTYGDYENVHAYCGKEFVKLPSVFSCALNNYNEVPEFHWIDEAEDLRSSLVSYGTRIQFCQEYWSLNEKTLTTEDCNRICVHDCRISHYNKTLTECMKETVVCVRG